MRQGLLLIMLVAGLLAGSLVGTGVVLASESGTLASESGIGSGKVLTVNPDGTGGTLEDSTTGTKFSFVVVRANLEVQSGDEVLFTKGTRGKGTCGTCGTKVFRILGKA